MANTKRVQIRKGSEPEHQSFTGALAEITYDTDKKSIRMHDGTTLGGFDVQKSRYDFLNGQTTLVTNVKYFADTVNGAFSVTLPTFKAIGDTIVIVDAEAYWDINNLTVLTQNNEKFKDYSSLIEAPLVCDVAGAALELIWEGSYWRLIA